MIDVRSPVTVTMLLYLTELGKGFTRRFVKVVGVRSRCPAVSKSVDKESACKGREGLHNKPLHSLRPPYEDDGEVREILSINISGINDGKKYEQQ